jgi:hypothetical protein
MELEAMVRARVARRRLLRRQHPQDKYLPRIRAMGTRMNDHFWLDWQVGQGNNSFGSYSPQIETIGNRLISMVGVCV